MNYRCITNQYVPRALKKPLQVSLPYSCGSAILLLLMIIMLSCFYFFLLLHLTSFRFHHNYFLFWIFDLHFLNFWLIPKGLFLLYALSLYVTIFTDFYMSKRIMFPKILKLNFYWNAIQLNEKFLKKMYFVLAIKLEL